MADIYRLQAGGVTYAVRALFEWNRGDGAEDEAAFTARVRAAGIMVPHEYRTRHGDLVVDLEGRQYRVYEWLDLEPPFEPPVSPAVAGEIGRLVGTLHRLGEAMDDPIDPWYTSPPSTARWQSILRRASERRVPWFGDLTGSAPPIEALSALTAVSVPIEVHRCHRDLNPPNVLPTPSGQLAVLDWENVGPLDRMQELGGVLVAWCTDCASVAPDSVRALIQGYEETSGIRPAIGLRSFATPFVVWLNFLAVQVEAFLEHETTAADRAFAEEAILNMLHHPISAEIVAEVIASADR